MASLRGHALALCLAWLAGCASPVASSGLTQAQGEQIVVALASCVPPWVTLSRAQIPVNGDAMASIATIPSAFDLEQGEIACVLAAGGDCGRVRACFGVELYEDPRCGVVGTLACEGQTLVVCRAGDAGTSMPSVRMRQDCSHEGRVCNPMGSCVDPLCDAPSTCEDDVIVRRCEGIELRRECDPDTTCGSVEGSCSGTGPACSRSTCVEGALRTCDLASHTFSHTVSCTARGAHCVDDGLDARCVPDGHACVPESTAPGCIGGDLTYCGADGTLHRYDCPAHGYPRCRATLDGTARCEAPGPALF